MKPAEQYIFEQPEPYKSILLHLQIVIESAFPNAMLAFKWRIPFYYLDNKPLCYLNPSKKKGYVDVGFWLSSPLPQYNELLISENRKVVKSLRYRRVEDIDAEVLCFVLEASFTKRGKGFYEK